MKFNNIIIKVLIEINNQYLIFKIYLLKNSNFISNLNILFHYLSLPGPPPILLSKSAA